MKWLTEEIATGAYNDVANVTLDSNSVVIDVRDLVDKVGNDVEYVNSKIEESLAQLKRNKKIVICCDYGLSRSNSIAIGVIKERRGISFLDAFRIARQIIDESSVKVEMLDTVFRAINKGEKWEALTTNSLNLCVTGSGGFLGRNLIENLDKGINIFTPSSKEINLLTNVIEFDLYVKSHNIDSILHLANPKIFTNTKALGDTLIMLKNVLDVCRNNHLKLIYLSGWEIYSGYRDLFLKADEDLAANPKGTYGETKWLCEILIKQYQKNYNLKSVILRTGPIYGVGGEKPKFIYNFIDKSLKGEKITTHSYLNGDPGLDLLYIDDLVELVRHVIPSDFIGEMNIGTGTLNSTFKIAGLICELNKSKSEISKVNIQDYVGNISMDFSKANKLFSWSPKIQLKEGLKKIIDNYEQSI